MKMKTVTSKGKRLDKLKELAKILATNIDECADVRALPQLAKQYRDTIREIEEIEGTDNSGDEIGQLNGWEYKEDPDKVSDSRNLHRSPFDWKKAKLRTQEGTIQQRMWQVMQQTRAMRDDVCFSPDAWVTTWDAHNYAVLAVVRKARDADGNEHTLLGLFNFSSKPQCVTLDSTAEVTLPQMRVLEGYEAEIIEC